MIIEIEGCIFMIGETPRLLYKFGIDKEDVLTLKLEYDTKRKRINEISIDLDMESPYIDDNTLSHSYPLSLNNELIKWLELLEKGL